MAQNAAEKLLSPAKLNSAWPARPFLKWAGGKTQLLPELIKRCPASYERYFEPFVGGGALLFGLQPSKAYISDVNPELINVYKIVKNRVEELIADLSRHIYEQKYFYNLRDADRSSAYQKWSALKKASRLIYLNKTCYNGLYRVNSEGQFNTPFGKYSAPKIVDRENLRACSKVLKTVSIRRANFDLIEDMVKAGDFVYFDPPYVPLSSTSNFTTYSKEGFDLSKQRALGALCKRLDKKGVFFLLSNSSMQAVRTIYKGFRQEQVWATRALNSVASKRGRIQELLIRNY